MCSHYWIWTAKQIAARCPWKSTMSEESLCDFLVRASRSNSIGSCSERSLSPCFYNRHTDGITLHSDSISTPTKEYLKNRIQHLEQVNELRYPSTDMIHFIHVYVVLLCHSYCHYSIPVFVIKNGWLLFCSTNSSTALVYFLSSLCHLLI